MFITFEGCEGSGKSTQVKLLCEWLESQGISVVKTREIGGTTTAELIREIVVNRDISTTSELFLIMAARHDHVNKVILPALKSGKWVVCDRFIDSTACYQGDCVYPLHSEHIGLLPDITIYLDIDAEEGLKRSKSTGDVNKFEFKNLEFHENIRKKYRKLCGGRMVLVDSSKSIKEVHEEIKKLI